MNIIISTLTLIKRRLHPKHNWKFLGLAQ